MQRCPRTRGSASCLHDSASIVRVINHDRSPPPRIVTAIRETAKPNRLACRTRFCYMPRPHVGQTLLFADPRLHDCADATGSGVFFGGSQSMMEDRIPKKTPDPLFVAAGSTVVFLCALMSGCADGPVPEMRRLNPWVRKAWDEDEQRVTTYHRKIADLAELRKKAPHMPPAERDETATQLAARLKEEKSAALRAEFVRTLA